MADSRPLQQIRRLMFNDERIGMGFDSGSGSAVGSPFPLEDIVVEDDPAAPGQGVLSTITRIDTHDQVMESLSLSVEAEGRYGFFSADLKAKFAESTNYNSTSTFLVVRVVVRNAFKRGRGFKITKESEQLLKANQESVFKRAFGDSFVRGIQTGGEFYSVIRITSLSVSTQKDLAAELEAEYTGFPVGADFDAKFAKANSNDSTKSELSATMFQRAGIGTEISPTRDIQDVLQRVKEFPVSVANHPIAYEVEVATYDTIPLPLPTPDEQSIFTLALSDARDKKLRYVQTRNDLDFARQHPEFFVDLPADSVLVSSIQAYTKLINEVSRHGVELSTGRMQPAQLFDPSMLAPPLVEPPPVPLVRAPSAPERMVRMPNLVGSEFSNISELYVLLSHGATLRSALDGTAFGGGKSGIPVPIPLDRDIAEFVNMGFTGGLKINWMPADPERIALAPIDGPISIDAQDPPPGTEVPFGSPVSVHIACDESAL